MASHANEEYSAPAKAPPFNYTMVQAFEWYAEGGGKHWNKITGLVDELSRVGVTALWLPPPTKASNKGSVGYDIYAGKGTNWGTKEELEATINKAREAGIVCYVDAVLNHRFGAERSETFKAAEVDNDNRTKEVTEPYDIDGWTGFDFPARGGKYSKQKFNFTHFTGVDYDAKGEKTAIFKIKGQNKDWADGVDSENANYDYLMGADLDHAHPEVHSDILNWGKWIIDEIGAAGFRFDAIKHIDRSFISDFVKHVREETNKPKMFAVGEFWKDSLPDLEAYLDSLGTQFSVFDCPLHYNFKEAGERGKEFDMRAIWDGSLVQKRPIDAVTLVDNHDTQVGQSLESWVSSGFKPLAYSLILLRPDGYPCVFWGDLYGCGGENPQEPVSQLSDIILARKLYAYGELRDYSDHMNCLGWVRMGSKDYDGCAVVLCNGDEEGSKRMEVGKERAGQKWIDVLGWYQGEVTIEEDGWAEFKCSSQSVSIWVHNEAKGRDEFKKSD